MKSEPVLGGNGGMAATVLSLGSVFVASKNKIQLVDVNHVHVSLAHIHSNVLKDTAWHHGIQLVDELSTCAGCLMANSIRAPTSHHTKAWAATYIHDSH